ncbi:hypothetical protein M5689_025113 [Euphorbia peplus]|nr:hypothetical protein M5689_025113 [Euphorbia peplus]
MLFMDTVVTGEYAYAPSSKMLPDDIEENPFYNNVINLVQNNELEYTFEDHLENTMNPNSVLGGPPIHIDDGPINFDNGDRIDTQKNTIKQKKIVTFINNAIKKKKGDKGKKKSTTVKFTDVISSLKESIEITAGKKIIAWNNLFHFINYWFCGKKDY